MDTRSAPYEFDDPRGRVSSRAWVRRFAVLGAGAVLLCATGCGSGDGAPQAASLGGASAVEATATPDPVREARSEGSRLARAGKYAAAVAAYESADLDADAERVRRRGARALYRSARRALTSGRYSSARKLALESRRLRQSAAARTVLGSANAKIAAARAAERERRRLARIARDARTCSSAEKTTVKSDGGTPPGCATYAADLAARRAARAAEQAQDGGGDDCDANYTGACLKPDSADYDCAGGSGDGPDYTGPVESVGSDPYDLDRDGDGVACESS